MLKKCAKIIKAYKKIHIEKDDVMKILVINAGSSSIKYQLFDMSNEKVLAKGMCDRIGIAGDTAFKQIGGGSFGFILSAGGQECREGKKYQNQGNQSFLHVLLRGHPTQLQFRGERAADAV